MNPIKKLFIAFFGLFPFASNAALQSEPPQSPHPQEQKTPSPKQPQSCRDHLHKVTDLDD